MTLVSLVASSCLVQRLLATHWLDWFMKQLAAEPPGVYPCAGVLMGGVRIQETSGAIAHPLVSRAVPWSLVSRLMIVAKSSEMQVLWNATEKLTGKLL